MIIPVWQQLYQSSHRLAQSIGRERNELATHTGTLDPLAQGVLVILTGQDRFLKGTLSDWTKEYAFSVLWGIETDSGDQLGLVKTIDIKPPIVSNIAEKCHAFPHRYAQSIPSFSARRWQGKSAFDAAREKVMLPEKTRLVQIENLTLVATETLLLSQIMALQSYSVHQVQGDFRQLEIQKSWNEKLTHHPDDVGFLLTHHTVVTSPGTYIRQLVQDIAAEMKLPAMTWSITRTRNGPYSQESLFLT